MKMCPEILRRCLQTGTAGLLVLTLVLGGSADMQTVSLVDFCGRTIHADGLRLTSHPDSRRFYFVVADTDCQLTMQGASPQDQVWFQFRFFLVYSLLRSPSGTSPSPARDHRSPRPHDEQETLRPCISDSYVQFYDGKNSTGRPLGTPLCGKSIPRPILSPGNFLTLRLVTRGQQPRVDFVGDFTSLRVGLNASACRRVATYFPCHNGRCIPPSLVCDSGNVDNCGDGTDQSGHAPAWCRGSPTILPTVSAKASSALKAQPDEATCVRGQESQTLTTSAEAGDKDGKHRPVFAVLAAILGAALLFWCCWNPGWLIWRVGACRYLPGCNSACAACHLCPRSCACRRAPKVMPHQGIAEPPV